MEQISKPELLRDATREYLDSIDMDNPPTPKQLQRELIAKTNQWIKNRNAQADKGDSWGRMQSLVPAQIAMIMAHMHHICRISVSEADMGSDYDMVAIYQPTGPNKGVYDTSTDTFREIARTYCFTLNGSSFDEVMLALRDMVPRKPRTLDRDLVNVNNGIFNYATKELMPHSPDYVFISKSHVDYVSNPVNPIIHNPDDGTDWDVESWMASLSEDADVVHLFWEILGAIIRPNVRWNKSAWLYSTRGNNGKGTLCALMRNLCGPGAYAATKLTDFNKDFMLEPLTRATAIIVDENDVGTYIDQASNLKAVITNDVITINRKFKTPIVYQFFGFMVQCLNEFPRVKDRSDSFYRRQLFIPMTKWFGDSERKYIKDDYLSRKEVLEYVLNKVLNMNYYTLSEPEACREVMMEYQIHNDPIRQFWEDVKDAFQWDLLPFTFLWDLYKSWSAKNNPSGKNFGRNSFMTEIKNIAQSSGSWYAHDKAAVRTGAKMNASEPLIIEYNLTDWMNPTYTGIDNAKKAHPVLANMYRGLERCGKKPQPALPANPIVDDEEE